MNLVDLCIRKQRLQRKEQSIQVKERKEEECRLECIPSVISQTLNPKNQTTLTKLKVLKILGLCKALTVRTNEK